MKNTYSCDYSHDAVDAVERYEPDSLGFSEAVEIALSAAGYLIGSADN